MNYNSPLPLYKEAMSLEKKRAALQKQLDEVVQRLESVHVELLGENQTHIAKPTTLTSKKTTKRAGRGELQSIVIKAMESAGEVGVKVNELSKNLGIKAANLYAWFQQAVKRNPAIKKIGAAHYHLIVPTKKVAATRKLSTRRKTISSPK